MYDFGDDELSIETYISIPWLIWSQLILILILLFFLLYCFTLLVPADHSDQTTSTASSTSTSQLVSNETQRHRSIPNRNTTTNVTNSCLETITQVGGGMIKREIGTSMGRRSRRLVREEEDHHVTESWESSSSALTPKYHHPCDYFRQATIAFLKCLGFDSTYDQNSFRRET
ncbi:hypothetical protein I3843_04G085000 [Carya illinoinensis]|uniref:Uncharacterized protein n=1 Tax=Carya illinoinensis TaxID=32201 RepID=A0A8T1QSJ1_CARIL|nr:uncharacterized protein LOC122307953 [Carya illinoinensis]KAG6657457.1 hypothetical protein CIPAW_04G092400 [Carya illinoinensis]KAG7983055.1 hypothetical protein I3843_04G085000 [Carya illinoinensis]